MPFTATKTDLNEKIKGLSVSTGVGLGGKKDEQRPSNIQSYYDWYENDGSVFAGINSLAEFSTGGGYVNTMPGLTPSELPKTSPPEKKLVDELGMYLNFDSLKPNIVRNMLISGFCFTPDEEVITDKGIRKIQDVCKGENILTKTGFNEVYESLSREYSGNVITVYPYRNALGIKVTEDHPFLVVSASRCPIWKSMYCKPDCKHSCTRKVWKTYETTWKKAKDLSSDDFVIQPIPKFPEYKKNEIIVKDGRGEEHIIPFSSDLFYFFGQYLGDGWCSGINDENISFEINNIHPEHIEKLSETIKNLNRKPVLKHRKENSTTLLFTFTALAKWMKKTFGENVYSKHIPDEWLGLPEEFKRALIEGMIDSDGTIERDRITISLVSEKLIKQLYLLTLSLGVMPCISNKDMPDMHINGKTYETKKQWVLRIYKPHLYNTKQRIHSGWRDGDFFMNLVRAIKIEPYEGLVYNLSVDDEPHICAIGALTHNCPLEISMNKYPSKCRAKILHPKTIKEITLGGDMYHGIESITQRINEKTVEIDGKNLVWYVNYEIANDKRGMSVVKPIEKLLATKNNTLDTIDEILARRLAPLIIWKTMRDETALKEAIAGRDGDEDIFLGRLTQEEMTSIAQIVDVEGDVKYWEYIEYIDRLIYKGLFAGDLDYWRQATQASAEVLLELVDRNIMGIQRQIKRSTELGIYQPLMKLNGYTDIPRIVWNQEDAKFRGIQLERVLQTGINTGFIQLQQYYELLKRSGLELHMPEKVVVPPKGGVATSEI